MRPEPRRKDRNRDGFFQRNFYKLPMTIQKYYGEASVIEKRDLVNELIKRSPDGHWCIDAQSPVISEWEQKYADGSIHRLVITKDGARAAQMWGGREKLYEAMEKRKVWKVRGLYQWLASEELPFPVPLMGPPSRLELQHCNGIDKQLANNDSILDLPGSERTARENTASLDQRPVPDKVTENLAKVENAMDTAITDANDLMTQFTVAMEPLSDTHRTIMQCLRMNIKAPPHPEFFAGVSGHSGVTYGIWTSLLDSNRDPR